MKVFERVVDLMRGCFGNCMPEMLALLAFGEHQGWATGAR